MATSILVTGATGYIGAHVMKELYKQVNIWYGVKMKILITGMNKNQCTEDFYKSQQLKVVSSQYSLIRCLRDMEHEVEQRVVDIGENLDKYDKVIVYIHNPSGFAGYVYNALYTIARRRDCILAFDDWQQFGNRQID